MAPRRDRSGRAETTGRDEKRRAWNLPAGAFDGTGDYAFFRRRRIATIPKPGAMPGLLGTVALVVDGGAIRRPLWLPADGLHVGLPRWWARTVSIHALRLNRPECRLPVCACCCAATLGP